MEMPSEDTKPEAYLPKSAYTTARVAADTKAAGLEKGLDTTHAQLKQALRDREDLGGRSKHTARTAWRTLAGSLWMLLLIPIAGCENNDDSSWCLEAQDERAVRATGQLLVSYSGLFGPAPSSSFSRFVFAPTRYGIVLEGCATDNAGSLWRFWSNWRVGEFPNFPVKVQSRDTELPYDLEGTIPHFYADLVVCNEGDCPKHMQAIFHADHGMPGASEGMGVVEAFDVAVGQFIGQMTVTNDRGEKTSVAANVSWPPSAVPDAGAGGAGGAGAMNDAGIGGNDGGP
jgi:hypothetical protein